MAIITDSFDGNLKGTNALETAPQYARCEIFGCTIAKQASGCCLMMIPELPCPQQYPRRWKVPVVMTDDVPNPTPDQRLFPIQNGRERTRVPEIVYMAAYEVYSHIHGPQQAMIDIEGRNCRGGFGSGELVAFLYARAFPKVEWSRRADEAFRGMEGLK